VQRHRDLLRARDGEPGDDVAATGRRAIGIELKPSYYRQMVKNVDLNPWYEESGQQSLFDESEIEDETLAEMLA